MVLMGPRWSLKSRVCKRQCWRTCYLKKKCNRLGVERKKIEAAHKDIQYPIQPMWFCGERKRERERKSDWGLYKRMNHCGLPMKAEEAVHKICDL